MNKIALSIITVLFCLVTWLKLDVITAATISFVTFLYLTITHLFDPNPMQFWNPSLLEFWIASFVWCGSIILIIWCVYRSFKKRKVSEPSEEVTGIFRRSRFLQAASWVLVSFMFVALTAPFLATVSPHTQGDLRTTRFVLPLTRGNITETTGFIYDSLGSDAEEIFKSLNDYLRFRVASIGLLDMSIDSSLNGFAFTSKQIWFLFGTDDVGRDVFSRVLYGARVSIGIGIAAALISLLIGGFVGFVAGNGGRFVDTAMMRFTDLFLAIPTLFLVIGIIAFLGNSIFTLIVVLSATGWMSAARLVRGEVHKLKGKEFILAARMLGVSPTRIIIRHMLPNIRPVLITAAVLQFANAVLAEAALSFLGLGVQPPTATWGNMMGEATHYLGAAWWIGFFPGLFLATVLVAAHVLGEGFEEER